MSRTSSNKKQHVQKFRSKRDLLVGGAESSMPEIIEFQEGHEKKNRIGELNKNQIIFFFFLIF